jgi:hypothetical protein
VSLDIAALAESREHLHQNHASSRPLSEGYEFVGLRGEEEFARLTGLALDTEERVGGDKGLDFTVPANRERRGFTVDVKTARKPKHLIVEQGKVHADAYVLAGYEDVADRVRFLGWESGRVIGACPVRDFGYGVLNHYLKADVLRPLDDLLCYMAPNARVKCGCGRYYHRGRIDWLTCLWCQV